MFCFSHKFFYNCLSIILICKYFNLDKPLNTKQQTLTFIELKTFADDKCNVADISVLDWAEKIIAKGENAGYHSLPAFSPFRTVYSKVLCFRFINRLKYCHMVKHIKFCCLVKSDIVKVYLPSIHCTSPQRTSQNRFQ